EVLVAPFVEDGGGERAEPLAVLDPLVDDVLHLRLPRVGQDRAGAEGPRADLGRALEPAHDLRAAEELGGLGGRVLDLAKAQAARRDGLLVVAVAVGRAKEGMLHAPSARPAELLMPHVEGCSQSVARVTGGRLDEDALERRLSDEA